MSDILASMRAFMRSLDPPPARSLHCGIAVWDMLRELKPHDTGPIGLGAALGGQPLYGIPVHVDPAMTAGRWEIREGEHVVASGDIAPPEHPDALYVPGIGFVVLNLPTEESR